MNSKRRCANCKRSKPTENMLIQGIQAFCNSECLIDYAGSNVSSLAKKGEKIQRQQHAQRKRKFKLNDKQLRTKAAQNALNAFIRLRDEGLPCISCQRHHTGQYHAGHYRPAGKNTALKFNEQNCHKQCAPCNTNLSGNLTKYRINLIEKIGENAVIDLDNNNEITRYTCEELKQIELHYKDKIKQLKAAA